MDRLPGRKSLFRRFGHLSRSIVLKSSFMIFLSAQGAVLRIRSYRLSVAPCPRAAGIEAHTTMAGNILNNRVIIIPSCKPRVLIVIERYYHSIFFITHRARSYLSLHPHEDERLGASPSPMAVAAKPVHTSGGQIQRAHDQPLQKQQIQHIAASRRTTGMKHL